MRDRQRSLHYSAIVPEFACLLTRRTNYSSGDDYVVEFLGYRFTFSAADFEQRVVAAAVKLGRGRDERARRRGDEDLVALAAQGVIDAPGSRLGRYLVRNWERVSLVEGESLVYWLRKLIFRGAWLDHQVKRGALEVVWDEDEAEFAYQHPGGGGGRCSSSRRCRRGTSCSSGRRGWPPRRSPGAAYLAALLAVDHTRPIRATRVSAS